MDHGVRRRVVQQVLGESLSRIRRFGEVGEAEFTSVNGDLADMLREWAAQMDGLPGDVQARREAPHLSGYSRWAETYDDTEDNPVIASEEAVIWEVIGDVAGTRVLDVGCGTGRHALAIAAAGAGVVGLDPTTEMLDHAKQKADARGLTIDLREGSIENLDPQLGEFDLVLCCLVLSHVQDLVAAVARLASHVRAGGRLIVSDFHPVNILLGFRTAFGFRGQAYVVPNHLHMPADYFGALSDAGLDVNRFMETGEVPRWPSLPQTLIMEARRPVA